MITGDTGDRALIYARHAGGTANWLTLHLQVLCNVSALFFETDHGGGKAVIIASRPPTSSRTPPSRQTRE
jgi:hypothetical protein